VFVGFGRALAERGCLACLGEEQQHQDRQADDRGESRVGAHRIDEVVDREGKWNGFHDFRASLVP
jgi:hypothetical protein